MKVFIEEEFRRMHIDSAMMEDDIREYAISYIIRHMDLLVLDPIPHPKLLDRNLRGSRFMASDEEMIDLEEANIDSYDWKDGKSAAGDSVVSLITYRLTMLEESSRAAEHLFRFLDKFIKKGFIDCVDFKGVSALMVAARYDNPKLAKLLLENGANPNIAQKDGWNSLHVAATKPDNEVVTALIESGKIEDINATLTDGATALFIAADNKNIKAVKLLLKNGANPNIPRKDGKTALSVAASQRDPKLVKLLLKGGALHEGLFVDGSPESLLVKETLEKIEVEKKTVS